MIWQDTFEVQTTGRGCYELTSTIRELVMSNQVRVGMAQLFVHHTSASLLMSENADPDVCRDLERFMSGLVPDGAPGFIHTAEGPDDMPAHVRSILTGSDLGFPVSNGSLALGIWQGIYLWEHRLQRHLRRLTLTVSGE